MLLHCQHETKATALTRAFKLGWLISDFDVMTIRLSDLHVQHGTSHLVASFENRKVGQK